MKKYTKAFKVNVSVLIILVLLHLIFMILNRYEIAILMYFPIILAIIYPIKWYEDEK